MKVPAESEAPETLDVIECGACAATLYQDTGGVRDPVAGFCVRCGGVSMFEVCDTCDPTARRFNRDVPRCIGRGTDGDGCGFRGGTSGDTCATCGGMVLDAAALAKAAT